MPEWKILITDGLDEAGLSILRAAAVVEQCPGISPAELVGRVGGFEALIVRGRTRVTAQVFAAGQRLKVVGRAGVGVDNIDLAAATHRKVTVVKSPRATTQAVAEHTLEPMRLSKFFPVMVTQMVSVGETTGELDTMLTKVADYYEEEVDVVVANLLTILEPVMLVVLGVIVGGIVIAMYMPLFKLITVLSGG